LRRWWRRRVREKSKGARGIRAGWRSVIWHHSASILHLAQRARGAVLLVVSFGAEACARRRQQRREWAAVAARRAASAVWEPPALQRARAVQVGATSQAPTDQQLPRLSAPAAGPDRPRLGRCGWRLVWTEPPIASERGKEQSGATYWELGARARRKENKGMWIYLERRRVELVLWCVCVEAGDRLRRERWWWWRERTRRESLIDCRLPPSPKQQQQNPHSTLTS